MQNKKLFAKVVPEEQSLNENYAGVNHSHENFIF